VTLAVLSRRERSLSISTIHIPLAIALGYSGWFLLWHRSSSQNLAKCRAKLGLSQSMAGGSQARHWSGQAENSLGMGDPKSPPFVLRCRIAKTEVL
jgi:hypothetical protein